MGGPFDFDGGIEEIQQPFTTSAFANLLVQLAPTLSILELSAHGGLTSVSNDLFAEPHEGSLDYALSHCTKLKRVYLPWNVTSAGFLAALSRSQELREISMVGNATATSASDISTSKQQLRTSRCFESRVKSALILVLYNLWQ